MMVMPRFLGFGSVWTDHYLGLVPYFFWWSVSATIAFIFSARACIRWATAVAMSVVADRAGSRIFPKVSRGYFQYWSHMGQFGGCHCCCWCFRRWVVSRLSRVGLMWWSRPKSRFVGRSCGRWRRWSTASGWSAPETSWFLSPKYSLWKFYKKNFFLVKFFQTKLEKRILFGCESSQVATSSKSTTTVTTNKSTKQVNTVLVIATKFNKYI